MQLQKNKIMKAHIKNEKTNKPICQNKLARSGRSFDQNYELLTIAEFSEVFNKQPSYCCKKCIYFLT